MQIVTCRRVVLGMAVVSAFAILPGRFAAQPRTPVAQASSVNYGSNGNCNNWNPHGWSWTNWSGWPSPVSAGVSGELDWYDGYQWVTELYDEKSAYGTSGSANVDNDLLVNEEYSGSWQELGSHVGAIFTVEQYSSHTMWCG